MSLRVTQHALMIAHTSRFARDGVGLWWALRASEAVDHSASVLMTLALLWTSNGWAVTVSNLTGCSRLLHLVVSVVLAAVYVGIFVVEVAVRDPAASYAPHESLINRTGLLPLRILLGLWYVRNVRRMLVGSNLRDREQREGTRSFYWLMLFAGTLMNEARRSPSYLLPCLAVWHVSKVCRIHSLMPLVASSAISPVRLRVVPLAAGVACGSLAAAAIHTPHLDGDVAGCVQLSHALTPRHPRYDRLRQGERRRNDAAARCADPQVVTTNTKTRRKQKTKVS